MPTTDAALAGSLLDELVASGAGFAVLHREDDVAAGVVTSDVDVAVADHPKLVLRLLLNTRHRHGLELIAVSPYDIAALSSFWCTAGARDGVQLDLLHDRYGRCRYGVRTDELLAARRPGTRWDRLATDDELVYLLRKRAVKRDITRVHALIEEAKHLGVEAVIARSEAVLSRDAARSFPALVRRGDIPSRRRLVGRELARYADRVVRPVGFWAHLVDAPADLAEAVAGRFDRFLVNAIALDLDADRGKNFIKIRSTRVRPALVVTTGSCGAWLRPDAHLPGTDADDVAVRVVNAMARRVERRLR